MKSNDIKIINPSNRLLSLDVFRGITIAAMVLVNNPGSWDFAYAPLKHSKWDGLTPTDLIFPFFMFIMGISMYLSYKKFDFKFSGQTMIKLLRRAVFLFLIGLFLIWLGLLFKQLNGLRNTETDVIQKIIQAATNLENLRILGVLQRLAIVSFIGSVIVLLVRSIYIPWIIGICLVFYYFIISVTGSYFENDTNIVTIIDRAIIGPAHMYTDHLPNGSKFIFDPLGLLSTIPCIAHVLIGFLVGKIISESKDNNQRIQKIFIVGTIILLIGFLLDYGFPINKKMWSSSYVLVSCGLGSLLLGLLIWIIDIKGYKRWSVFFESFGVNPMFIYVISAILGTLISGIEFSTNDHWTSVKSIAYQNWLNPFFGNYFGSLVFAILFVLINWVVGHLLFKRKIFIKL